MPAPYIENGTQFNYFTLTGNFIRDENNTRKYECICICGNKNYYLLSSLTSGNTKSCGCKRRSLISISGRTHGLSCDSDFGKRHPLYVIWNGMKNRCKVPSDISYKNYGGRGIKIYSKWDNDFVSFYNWAIENGWSPGLSLERIRVNKNYHPNNCKWVIKKRQWRNKRNTIYINAFGENKCLMDWVEDNRCIVPRGILYHRIVNLKWNAEKAITTKKCRNRKVSVV